MVSKDFKQHVLKQFRKVAQKLPVVPLFNGRRSAENYLFSSFIQPHNTVPRNTKQPRYQLVLPLHFLPNQKERHSIGFQRTSQFDVSHFSHQIIGGPLFVPLIEHSPITSNLALQVAFRKEWPHVDSSSGFIEIAVFRLSLNTSELHCLVECDWMCPTNDSITTLKMTPPHLHPIKI